MIFLDFIQEPPTSDFEDETSIPRADSAKELGQDRRDCVTFFAGYIYQIAGRTAIVDSSETWRMYQMKAHYSTRTPHRLFAVHCLQMA